MTTDKPKVHVLIRGDGSPQVTIEPGTFLPKSIQFEGGASMVKGEGPSGHITISLMCDLTVEMGPVLVAIGE